MLIEKQENGWSLSTAEHTGLWHLIFRDKIIIDFFESTTTTSTSMDLFIGTLDELNQYIIDNNLTYDTENSLETIVNVVEPIFVMPEYIAETNDEVVADEMISDEVVADEMISNEVVADTPEYIVADEMISDEVI